MKTFGAGSKGSAEFFHLAFFSGKMLFDRIARGSQLNAQPHSLGFYVLRHAILPNYLINLVIYMDRT